MSHMIVKLLKDGHPQSGMGPSDLVEASAFTTSDTTETIHAFCDAPGRNDLSVGVWECAPCREEIAAYPCDEMMQVLSGSVTLTDKDGNAQTFTTGDTFFIAKGTPCVWEITETLRKFYMLVN